MDKKQLIEMIDAVSYEKSMPEERVRQAMEAAIAALARREAKPDDGEFGARIAEDGEVSAWRVWHYVDEVENEALQRQATPEHPAGTSINEEVPEPQWTRQGLQVVKQVLYQRLKEGLRKTVAETWRERVGEVVTGTVKRACKGGWILDLGEPAEGVLAGRDTIPNEHLRVGSRVRVLVKAVNDEGNGPGVVLSRSDDALLRELISIEVPEVGMGMVIIHAVARDAGQRAKIAVSAGPGLRNSPAGTCVGMRGVRAQAVSNEINGERLDFVEWSDSPAEFLVAAMAPGEIETMIMDENEHRVLMGVNAEKLGRAIGGGGQNIRLASRLTGWKIEAMSTEDLAARQEKEDNEAAAALAKALELDMDMGQVLVEEGFYTIDDIAFCGVGDLLSIEGFDEAMVTELQERARDVLLTQELEIAAAESNAGPQTLEDLEGISSQDVAKLTEQGIDTLGKLADCGIMDVMWDEERDDELGQWILAARAATQ
jgi:N utilization substance protein A